MTTLQEKSTNFFRTLVSHVKREIHVAELARVVKYSAGSGLADVQPLSIKSDGDKDGMILSCPVTQSCSPEKKPLKKGDTVVIVYCDYDIDNFEHGEYTHASSRTHDANDAIVVGVI